MELLNYLRSFRFYDLSIFDFLGSMVGIYLINLYFNYKDLTFFYLLIIPIALISHFLFNINSTLNKKFFENGFNFYKVIIWINILLILKIIYNNYVI